MEEKPIQQPANSYEQVNDSHLNDLLAEMNASETNHTNPVVNEEERETELDNKPTGKKSLARLVHPKNAVRLLDIIIPSVLLMLLKLAGLTIDKDKLKLDKDEKETLEPFLDDFLQTVEINFDNPYTNLGVGLAIVYGTKIMDNYDSIEKRKDIKEIKKAEKEDIAKDEELTDAEKFEQEYILVIEEIKDKKKFKTMETAKKWFGKNQPERLKGLMNKYGVDKPELYYEPKIEL